MSKPMFTKRHYEAIAEALSDARLACHGYEEAQGGVCSAMHVLIDLFKEDNPKFKEGLFLKDCSPYKTVQDADTEFDAAAGL